MIQELIQQEYEPQSQKYHILKRAYFEQISNNRKRSMYENNYLWLELLIYFRNIQKIVLSKTISEIYEDYEKKIQTVTEKGIKYEEKYRWYGQKIQDVSAQQKFCFVRDCCKGLINLQNNRILQMDFKKENVVKIGKQFKLIDFDLALYLGTPYVQLRTKINQISKILYNNTRRILNIQIKELGKITKQARFLQVLKLNVQESFIIIQQDLNNNTPQEKKIELLIQKLRLNIQKFHRFQFCQELKRILQSYNFMAIEIDNYRKKIFIQKQSNTQFKSLSKLISQMTQGKSSLQKFYSNFMFQQQNIISNVKDFCTRRQQLTNSNKYFFPVLWDKQDELKNIQSNYYQNGGYSQYIYQLIRKFEQQRYLFTNCKKINYSLILPGFQLNLVNQSDFSNSTNQGYDLSIRQMINKYPQIFQQSYRNQKFAKINQSIFAYHIWLFHYLQNIQSSAYIQDLIFAYNQSCKTIWIHQIDHQNIQIEKIWGQGFEKVIQFMKQSIKIIIYLQNIGFLHGKLSLNNFTYSPKQGQYKINGLQDMYFCNLFDRKKKNQNLSNSMRSILYDMIASQQIIKKQLQIVYYMLEPIRAIYNQFQQSDKYAIFQQQNKFNQKDIVQLSKVKNFEIYLARNFKKMHSKIWGSQLLSLLELNKGINPLSLYSKSKIFELKRIINLLVEDNINKRIQLDEFYVKLERLFPSCSKTTHQYLINIFYCEQLNESLCNLCIKDLLVKNRVFCAKHRCQIKLRKIHQSQYFCKYCDQQLSYQFEDQQVNQQQMDIFTPQWEDYYKNEKKTEIFLHRQMKFIPITIQKLRQQHDSIFLQKEFEIMKDLSNHHDELKLQAKQMNMPQYIKNNPIIDLFQQSFINRFQIYIKLQNLVQNQTIYHPFSKYKEQFYDMINRQQQILDDHIQSISNQLSFKKHTLQNRRQTIKTQRYWTQNILQYIQKALIQQKQWPSAKAIVTDQINQIKKSMISGLMFSFSCPYIPYVYNYLQIYQLCGLHKLQILSLVSIKDYSNKIYRKSIDKQIVINGSHLQVLLNYCQNLIKVQILGGNSDFISCVQMVKKYKNCSEFTLCLDTQDILNPQSIISLDLNTCEFIFPCIGISLRQNMQKNEVNSIISIFTKINEIKLEIEGPFDENGSISQVLKAIGTQKNLIVTWLTLKNCSIHKANQIFQDLTIKKEFRYLKFTHCYHFVESFILNCCQSLKQIQIDNKVSVKVDIAFLKTLFYNNSLESIRFFNTKFDPKQLSLKNLNNLRSVAFWYCQLLTNQFLKTIPHTSQKSIHNFQLNSCPQLTNYLTFKIQKMDNISSIYLADVQFNCQSLLHFSCKNLQQLQLHGNDDINNKLLEKIDKKWPRIKWLRITRCVNVTYQIFRIKSIFKNLRTLHTNLMQFTPDQIYWLKRQRNMKVFEIMEY